MKKEDDNESMWRQTLGELLLVDSGIDIDEIVAALCTLNPHADPVEVKKLLKEHALSLVSQAGQK